MSTVALLDLTRMAVALVNSNTDRILKECVAFDAERAVAAAG